MTREDVLATCQRDLKLMCKIKHNLTRKLRNSLQMAKTNGEKVYQTFLALCVE